MGFLTRKLKWAVVLSATLLVSFCAASTEIRANASLPTIVPPVVEWKKYYGEGEAVFQVIQTSDNGYAFIGKGRLEPPRLFKVDSSGNMQWNKTVSGYGLVQTNGGGIAFVGGSPYGVLTLFTTDLNGNSQWNQTYGVGGAGGSQSMALVRTNDGGFALAANNNSVSDYVTIGGRSIGLYVSILVKTDSDGRMQWKKIYKVTGDNFIAFELRSMIQTSDGGYALAGSATMNRGDTDFCVVKINSQGDLQWTKTFGGPKDDDANSLIQTSDGALILAGNTYSFGTGSSNAWLVKTDFSGNLELNRTYGGSDYARANCVIQTSDGGLTFLGQSHAVSSLVYSVVWLVKTDLNGEKQWDQTYDQGWVASLSERNSLIEARDGSLVMAGIITLGSNSRGSHYLIKTEPFLPPPTLIPTSSPSSTSLISQLPTLIVVVVVLVTATLAILFIIYRARRNGAKLSQAGSPHP